MRAALALLLGMSAALASAEHYGAPIAAKNPVTLDTAVAQLGANSSSEVLVEGRVDKVCKMKGCWLGLKSSTGELHVTFKDYAFFVPASLIGKTVLVEGTLSKQAMSLEQTKHYVKDAGGDPATVTEPRVHYELVAKGVQVKS